MCICCYNHHLTVVTITILLLLQSPFYYCYNCHVVFSCVVWMVCVPSTSSVALLQVPYATFVPNHLMCLFAIGRQSLLVVRVGYSETTVLPVSFIVLTGAQYFLFPVFQEYFLLSTLYSVYFSFYFVCLN